MATCKEISGTLKINLGFYETQDISATISLEPGDDPVKAHEQIRAFLQGEAKKCVEDNRKIKRGGKGERV